MALWTYSNHLLILIEIKTNHKCRIYHNSLILGIKNYEQVCKNKVLSICLCMSFQRKVLILEDSSVWVMSKFNPLFFIAKFLALAHVLCLCVITLMAKAMRKALAKNPHDIMHHLSSSDSFNRPRIFCLAGTVYLKWKFQNPPQLFDCRFLSYLPQ